MLNFLKTEANKTFTENGEKVRKSINNQFTIFFLLAFGVLMFEKFRIECLGGMLIIAISSLAKFYICTTNEKTN